MVNCIENNKNLFLDINETKCVGKFSLLTASK